MKKEKSILKRISPLIRLFKIRKHRKLGKKINIAILQDYDCLYDYRNEIHKHSILIELVNQNSLLRDKYVCFAKCLNIAKIQVMYLNLWKRRQIDCGNIVYRILEFRDVKMEAFLYMIDNNLTHELHTYLEYSEKKSLVKYEKLKKTLVKHVGSYEDMKKFLDNSDMKGSIGEIHRKYFLSLYSK